MKSDFHFHFYSRIGIVATLLFALFFIHQSIKTPVSTHADDTNEIEINAWAWSDLAGWASLNCVNDFDADGTLDDTCASLNYGLNITNAGAPNGSPHIQGCAWAGTPLNSGGRCSNTFNSCLDDLDCPGGTCDPVTLGWICFSNPVGEVTNAPVNGVPTSSTYINALDPTSYASILDLEPMAAEGWKLGFPIADQISPYIDYPVEGCFNCYEDYSYACSITGVACDPSGTPCPDYGSPPQAQTCGVNSINYNCDNCLEYQYYDTAISLCSQTGTDCTIGGQVVCDDEGVPSNICMSYSPGDLEGVVGAYDCTDCTIEDYSNVCGFNANQANINRCDSCDSVWQTPGVMIDNRHNQVLVGGFGYLCGWAWNSWLDPAGNDYGLGWFQFGPRINTSTRPYLSVENGSIYAKGDIFSRYYPPFGRTNASYLIESGGSISNFISSSTLNGLYQGEMPNRPAIDFLSLLPSGKYKNALGTIDYKGLISTARISGLNHYNKYGSLIVTDPADFENEFVGGGNGKVIYLSSDLTTGNFAIKSGVVGSIEPERGSITVVVDGNLTITDDIVYQNIATISNLKQIPSIVWVIKGDVYVDPVVSELVGTFVVLGQGNNCGSASACGLSYPLADESCGQFVTCTGDSTECAVNQLQVKGNVLAHQFELCRTYYDNVNFSPAEYFINDGRLQTNPPPGFLDFSKVVPRFNETPN